MYQDPFADLIPNAAPQPTVTTIVPRRPDTPPPRDALGVQQVQTGIADTGIDNRRADQADQRSERNQAIDNVARIRDQFRADPQIGTFGAVRNAYQALQNFAQNADNPYSDLSTVFAFMKTLDPAGSVQQGEQQSFTGAAGGASALQSMIERLQGSGGITAENYQQILEAARNLYEPRASYFNEQATRYRQLLGELGVPESEYGRHIPMAPMMTGGQMGGYIDEVLTERPLPPNPAGREPAAAPLESSAQSNPLNQEAAPSRGRSGGTYNPALDDSYRTRPLADVAAALNSDNFYQIEERNGQVFMTETVATEDEQGRVIGGANRMPTWTLNRSANGRTYMRNIDTGEEAEITAPDISARRTADGGLGQRLEATIGGMVNGFTLNSDDELTAAMATLGGESYNDRLAMERAVDRFDQGAYPVSRFTGQIVGGAGLPMGNVRNLGNLALRGGGYGAAYGALDAGNLGERATNALVGGSIGALASPLIGAGMNRAGDMISAQMARRASERQMIPSRAEAVASADRLGVTNALMPSTVGGTGTQMATGGVGVTFGRIPIDRGIARETNALANAVDTTARRIGTVRDIEGAGVAAQEGVEAAVTRRTTQERGLFNGVAIPPDANAVTTNSLTALNELTAGFQSNPRLSEMFRSARLEGYRDALANGRLSWTDMNALRQRVGEMIGSPTAIGDDVTTGQLRRLYGAIREDMRATARATGPNVERRLERAFQFSERLHRDREQVFRRILGPRMNATGEGAYGAIMSMTKREGGDIHGLRRLFAALPAEEANSIRATALSRMGLARQQNGAGDAFATSTFVTNWSAMSPQARRVLAGRGGAEAITDLVGVAQRVNAGRRFTNWSNSAVGVNVAGSGAIGATSLAALPNLVLYTAGSFLGGVALASPILTRALAAGVRQGTPEGVSAALTRAAARNPAISQEALGLRDMILRTANDNLAPAARQAAASQPGQGQNEDNPR